MRLLCISINLPYVHVWNTVVMSGLGALICYLELLEKLQKQLCRTVAPSLAFCLELLADCQNVASLSFFYWYYFGRCSSEMAQLVPLPIDCFPLTYNLNGLSLELTDTY